MTDVLVVGAGPTGLTMAAELRRHGLIPRVIDRAPAPATTSRAMVVQPRTLEVFDDMGIAGQALARGRTVNGFTGVFAGREPVRLHFGTDLSKTPELDTAYPQLLMLPQDYTEALLTEHLEELGGTVERGVALESYRETEGGVMATLRAGGTTEEIHARWIIGSDGAHSAVRAGAGIPFEGVTYDNEFIMADARLDWELPDGELYVFPSKGILAAWSMPGENRYRVFGNVPAGEGEPSLADFQRLLDDRLPIPAKIVEATWVSRYRLHRRGVPRYRAGHAFLAGDAAHIHSPVGAQGMNTGIQDAYNLAWKMALVAAGASEDLLDTYNAERHPVGAALLRTTDRAFGAVISESHLAGVVRGRVAPHLMPALLGRPRFMKFVLGAISQLKIGYAKSQLSRQSGLWDGGPEPGARAWDGIVRGDGVGRLHEVMRGPRHTVLLFAADSPAEPLIRYARDLEERYGSRLAAHVVTLSGANGLGDPDGVIHRRYDARAETVYVIRPDGYVGYRGRDLHGAESDLASRLAGAI
jgi:2-polyprenyl-6-methoxyphenol hydroxylase-like FAD-dependent oxidoreductase